LTSEARTHEKEGRAKKYRLNQKYEIMTEVEVEAGGFNRFIIE